MFNDAVDWTAGYMFVGLKCMIIHKILILFYRCKVVRLLLDTRTLARNR